MCHKPFSQLFAACFVAVALGVATSQAAFIELNPNGTGTPVVLADLLSGQVEGLIVGDKTFSEFFYSTLPNDDMPVPEDVNVIGFSDVDGHFGISFQGGFLDFAGGGISDARLGFTVKVSEEAAANGFRISDAHLFASGVGLGDDSFFAIDETFLENSKKLNAFSTTLNGASEDKLSDWVFFDKNYKELHVTKDILAISGDPSQPARSTVISQSFSQVQIPEPATIGLVALGLLGVVLGKREF